MKNYLVIQENKYKIQKQWIFYIFINVVSTTFIDIIKVSNIAPGVY